MPPHTSEYQVWGSKNCKSYKRSSIPKSCQKLEIENGSVCYTHYRDSKKQHNWEANVTCQYGFHLVNIVRHTCSKPSSRYIWGRSTVQPYCVPDKQDESLPVENVIVPIVIVLLIALFGIISVVIYRKRKVSRNSGPNCQNGTESRVANQANDHHVDIIDGNDSEYVYIADSYIKPKTIDDSEYNTLHENVIRNNCQNYDHIPVHSDTYAHTTSSCSNVQSDTDTYSHVYNGKHGNSRSGLNTEMGNIYNKLQVDDQNKLKAFDSTSEDPDYDHANTHSCVLASIELDTYGHVTNGLDEDDCDYAMCLDYDDNFVSEK